MKKLVELSQNQLSYLLGTVEGRLQSGEGNAGNFAIDLLNTLREADARPHDDIEKIINQLKGSLAVATQATTCARCGVFKHTPWRDGDGYICAGCLGKERDEARAHADQLQKALDVRTPGFNRAESADKHAALLARELRVTHHEKNELERDRDAWRKSANDWRGACGAPSKLEELVVVLEAETKDLRVKLAQETARADQLLDAVDKDATGLSRALGAIKRTITGFSWVCESRGPYAWDDDQYKRETYNAFKAILDILTPALSKSGDIANQAWQAFEGGRILKLKIEVTRLRAALADLGKRQHDSTCNWPTLAVKEACHCGADEHNAKLAAVLQQRDGD